MRPGLGLVRRYALIAIQHGSGGFQAIYLAEQSQAVFVRCCAVLQQSMALLELVLASLTLF